MGFLDQLNETVKSLNEQSNNFNNDEVDSPYKHLKHPELQFNKDNAGFMVRVLPPVNPENFFAVSAKDIWLNVTNSKGTEIKVNAVLPYAPKTGESMLTENLATWAQQKRVPNLYNKEAKPTKKFYINVIQVAPDQQGNMVMERDQQGNPIVRIMKIPVSAYQALITKISDPMYRPEGAGEYGIIGVQNAYPIRITKPAPGGMAYTVDVFEKNLGALPQGWEGLAEDLEYQATPTEVYNPGLIQHVMDVVNGVEGQGNNNPGGQQQQQQQQNYNNPQQNFSQPQTNQHQGGGFNQGGYSQPQQQQQQQQQNTYNQPQQNFTQAPPTQQNFNQAPPSQQNFNQAPPIQEPMGTQMPQQGFQQQQPSYNASDASPYVDNLEANMPTNFNAIPDVVDSAPEVPPMSTQEFEQSRQQQAPVQNQTQTQAPQTAMGNGSGQVQNVDDILAQMQNKAR